MKMRPVFARWQSVTPGDPQRSKASKRLAFRRLRGNLKSNYAILEALLNTGTDTDQETQSECTKGQGRRAAQRAKSF
jgi:hypothetical protein